LGSGEASNCISGKIRFGDETLATVSGHWDQEVFIKDKRSEVTCWCCFVMQHSVTYMSVMQFAFSCDDKSCNTCNWFVAVQHS